MRCLLKMNAEKGGVYIDASEEHSRFCTKMGSFHTGRDESGAFHIVDD